MIGLDTNVLVRYLTQDDVRQARRASARVAAAVERGDRCFVGTVVLCELAWVLRGAYGYDRGTIAEVVERLLATAQFTIDSRDAVRAALEGYRNGKGDFADYVIGQQARESGCRATATFDQRLKGSRLFDVLAP